MQYKEPQQYNPANYACYAVTSVKEDFTLNTIHPSGLQEYLDYDIYDIGDKTLIAFIKIRFYATDFLYRVVSENYTEDIQSENYEFIEDVLNDSYDKNKNAFFIMQSVSDYQQALGGTPPPVDDARRCDLEDYAAVGFLDTNKEGAPDVCDRSQLGGENVVGWTVFLSSMSNIYIVKVQYSNELDDRHYKDWPIRVNYCRTFSHAVKMAYEWNILKQEPWNAQDNIAIRCNNSFINWSIPQDAIDELIDSQPDTVLSLYLSGDQDPRRSIEENSLVPTKFKNWFMSKIRYRTLASLIQNYPQNLNIPSSMLEKENIFFETEIYKYCVENQLDINTITPIGILENAYFSSPNYKETNNSITDIIKKNVQLEDNELIKEYVKNLLKPVDVRNENN
jgi:hypothetical protein